MNHETAEADALVERYANGTLPAADTAGFEEHLVDCAQCLDRLQWTERLRDDLRRHAAAVAPAVPAAPARARVSRLALAAGLAAAALAGGALASYRAGWQRELARSRAAADEWRVRYEAARDAAAVRPLVNVAVLALAATRGTATAPPLAPTEGRAWLLLSLEVEPDPALPAYAARVTAPDGRELWRAEGLAPARSAVTLALPSALAGPGDYDVALDGLRADGRREPVGSYRFRVAAR
jgi:putative zinc finger protein